MTRTHFFLAVVVLMVAACGSAGPTPTATQTAAGSPPASPSPTASTSPSPAQSTAVTSVATAVQAAAVVLASDPHFGSVRPANPDLIGQCCTYETQDLLPGYQVTVNLGWNDCPSGCISHSQSVFTVSSAGTITLLSQDGDAGAPIPSGEGTTATVTLHLRAGPTCPVVRNPPDPACEPRAVASAEVVLKSPDGSELGKATSNADGEIQLQTPPGAYYVEPQPVEGLLGTAPAFAYSVVAGETVDINVDYDTGIR